MYDNQKCCSHVCGIKYREKCKLPSNFRYDFFDTIDPTVAYWAGFIISDGSLSREGSSPTLSFGLNRRDSKHLELFQNEIGASHVNISYSNDACYLRFSHEYLRKSVARWGIVPNKTYDLREIPALWSDPTITPHLVRGLWDGDGSIVIPKNNGQIIGGHVSITGNSWTMEWLDTILNTIGFNTYVQHGVEKILDDGTPYHTTKITIGKQYDSICFLKWAGYLNEDIPSLERKRIAAKELVEWYTEKQAPRRCQRCDEVFFPARPYQTFCSTQCRTAYNTAVYRLRLKNK